MEWNKKISTNMTNTPIFLPQKKGRIRILCHLYTFYLSLFFFCLPSSLIFSSYLFSINKMLEFRSLFTSKTSKNTFQFLFFLCFLFSFSKCIFLNNSRGIPIKISRRIINLIILFFCSFAV